jgi:hypothetical protein
MRSNLAFMRQRMRQNLAESGTDIVLEWTEWTGTPTIDPVTKSKIGTSSRQTETIKGHVHFVQIASAQVRQFNEVQDGDCIIDIDPAVTIEGREALTFTIAGERWVQKKVSEKLARAWGDLAQGIEFERPILLTKAG